MKKLTTEDRQKIYDLVESGHSLNTVADELGFGKTTVHTAYQKMKNENQNRSERSDNRNGNEVLLTDNLTKVSNTNTLTNINSAMPKIALTNKNVPVTEVLSGPFVELMELLPEFFRGLIESKTEDAATQFAWYFACFLSQYHTSVEVITDNFDKFKLMLLINRNPGHDKITLWRCTSLEQIKNEIQRTPAKIVILNNLESLKISTTDWMALTEANPEKAIIGITKQVAGMKPELHFIARIVSDITRSVFIEHKFGEIRNFYLDLGASEFYKSKKRI